jgi:LysM repeat protein
MKMPTFLKRKKLSASTARRSRGLGMPDAMAYEEMSEPNMKLSRALLIVLVLHIVAVAGIIAFNTIKTREALTANPPEPAASVTENQPETAVVSAPAEGSKTIVPNELTTVAAKTGSKAPAKTEERSKTVITTPAVPDSGEIYVVVKGDNPVTIARHFHVNYDALLELNQIEDPRKLQIGQKLHIPKREESSKHKSD